MLNGHWVPTTKGEFETVKQSAEEGLKRLIYRTFKDRLDQEKEDFHNRVVEGYRQVAERYKDRLLRWAGKPTQRL